METTRRNEAARRGLRMAARLAVVGGLLAASTSRVQAQDSDAEGRTLSASGAVDDVAANLRVQAGNCGCSPCWGPPAPPAMPAMPAGAATAHAAEARA